MAVQKSKSNHSLRTVSFSDVSRTMLSTLQPLIYFIMRNYHYMDEKTKFRKIKLLSQDHQAGVWWNQVKVRHPKILSPPPPGASDKGSWSVWSYICQSPRLQQRKTVPSIVLASACPPASLSSYEGPRSHSFLPKNSFRAFSLWLSPSSGTLRWGSWLLHASPSIWKCPLLWTPWRRRQCCSGWVKWGVSQEGKRAQL